MKAIITILLCGICLTGFSQNETKNFKIIQKIAKLNVENWSKGLTLNQEQSEMMFETILDYETKRFSIIDSKIGMSLKNRKLEKLEEKHYRNIKVFLTREQFVDFIEEVTDY